MDELEQILRAHAARYPKMQPSDAVKLIYQNEFGGGHLITDKNAALAYLRSEYATTRKDLSVPLYEDIGNGIVRVHLAALDERDLDALGRAFLRSAAAHHGTKERFREKLSVLDTLTQAQLFSFDADALRHYLFQYEEAGFPVVSHSRCYREAYLPAYRIVLKP